MAPFCFYCDRRFPSAAALDRHMKRACRLAPAIARYKSPPAPLESENMSRTKKAASSNPAFLTAEDLSARGRTKAKIGKSISVFHREDGRTSLFLLVTVNGETFTLGVRCGSPDRIALQNVCGRNLLTWPGQTIELYRSEGSQGGTFVNVHDPKRTQR